MRVAEMIRATRTILFLSISVAYVHSFPLQVLPSIPGYIPVYIRHGDQPLEEINPALAEAFHEGSHLSKNLNLDNISDSVDTPPKEEELESYNVYPVGIKQINNYFSNKDEEEKKSEREIMEMEATKFAADVNKKSYTEKSKQSATSKPVVVPLNKKENDAIEEFQIDVRVDTKASNDVHDPNLSPFQLPADEINRNINEEIFKQYIEVDPIANYSIQPDPSPIKDVSQSSVDKDAPTSTITNKDIPIKEQHLPNTLVNDEKLLNSSGTFKSQEKRAEIESSKEQSK